MSALGGDEGETHVEYLARDGTTKEMPLGKMAEKLTDQNLKPPMRKSADGKLQSAEEAGEFASAEELAREKPGLARHARIARLAHARLRQLGHDLGPLVGASDWSKPKDDDAGAAAPRRRLCATRRVVIATRRDGEARERVVVRASELFGVIVLRAAWRLDDDGERGERLDVPPRAKVALFVVVARRMWKAAKWRDGAVTLGVTAAALLASARLCRCCLPGRS